MNSSLRAAGPASIARVSASLGFAATVALLAPSALAQEPSGWGPAPPAATPPPAAAPPAAAPAPAPGPPAAPPPGYAPGYPAYPPGYGPPPGYAPPAPYYAPGPYGYGPPPGPVVYGAPGYYRSGIVVGAPYEYRSVPAMATGIVGVSLGGVLLVSALIVAAQADSCVGGFDQNANPCSGSGNGAVAAGLGIGGAIAIAVGIPLIIYGAKKVPVGAGAPVASGGAPSSPLPQWAGMPAGRGWRWEF